MHTRYYNLDAMRGFAAISVVIYHLQNKMGVSLLPDSYLAVDFFFALSGFVIAKSYSQMLSEGMSALAFVKKRAVRLYPMLMLGVLLGAIKAISQLLILKANTGLGWYELFVTLVFNVIGLPTPIVLDSLFPLDGPAWSLFFELVANVAFAILIFRLGTYKLFGVALASAAVITLGVFYEGTLNLGWNWSTFVYGLARVCFSFTIGVVFARQPAQGRRVGALAVLLILLLLGLLLTPIPSSLRATYDLVVALVVMPMILWLSLRVELVSSLYNIWSAPLG